MSRYLSLIAGAALATLTVAANAAPTIVGNGGTGTPNGVVTASPGGANYFYVSTDGGLSGVGQIAGVGGGANGSTFTGDAFTANAGGSLTFYFNYVTSDGAQFADYAWASLIDSSSSAVVDYIFSARTTPSGDTVPGFGLPALTATLTPVSTPIIAGAPAWDKLGGSSNSCFAVGCGYTGWIKATYTIASAGSYQLQFGVTNTLDGAFNSGLAFNGAFIDGNPVLPGVPEPASWAMLIAGFGLTGAAMRRRRAVVAA
jgi:PEP-CTERM motif